METYTREEVGKLIINLKNEPHEAIRTLHMAAIRHIVLTQTPPPPDDEDDDQRTLTFETKLALAALRNFEIQTECSIFESKSKEYVAYGVLIEAIKRAEDQFEREIKEITGRPCDGSLRDKLKTGYSEWLETYKKLKDRCSAASLKYVQLHYKNPMK